MLRNLSTDWKFNLFTKYLHFRPGEPPLPSPDVSGLLFSLAPGIILPINAVRDIQRISQFSEEIR
jgi:hypothetical protein